MVCFEEVDGGNTRDNNPILSGATIDMAIKLKGTNMIHRSLFVEVLVIGAYSSINV